MLGALLDAHPNVAMSDELDVLDYVSAGYRKREIFYLIERSARREALKGRVTARRLTPYSFAVPDQWQGRTSGLKVMGDTKAGITTQRLGADPHALDRVRLAVDGVQLKLIHVVRNPFDPIGLMRIRGRRSFDDAVRRYFDNCRILRDIHASVDPAALEVVRYEDLVTEPEEVLAGVCRFLEVEPASDYLAACGSIVDDPRAERTEVDWTDRQVEAIHGLMAGFPFLNGYTFERSGRAS